MSMRNMGVTCPLRTIRSSGRWRALPTRSRNRKARWGWKSRWGHILLGLVYRPRRSISPSELVPRLQDLSKSKFETVELWADVSVDQDWLRAFLRADAERALKPGQRFVLRRKYPYNYGRTHGM